MRVPVAASFERTLWLSYVGANAFGVAVLVIGAAAAVPIFPEGSEETRLLISRGSALGVVWFALAATTGRRQIGRILRPGLAWLGADRSPTKDEQAALYAAPTRAVWSAFGWWLGGAIWVPLLAHATDYSLPGRLVWKAEGLLILGFLFASALSFLLFERGLRPVYAIALRVETPLEPFGVGVTRRSLIVWFAVAGAPLIAVGVQPLGSTFDERANVWSAMLVIVFCAMSAGCVISLLEARSLAQPLRAMRAALERVERGEFDVEIEVADASEVGLVQAGFNRTVAALRERDRLRELFGHHVGADVAEHALSAERSLGGEVRKVSVMFVDIIGSTSLAQRQPPATVVRKLNRFFDAVVKDVEAEGGWVNKFEGDAALCVFGAPSDLGDHADRVLRAAVRLRVSLLGLAKRYPDVDAAIGVSSGEVVAGNIGASHRYEYTVIGDAVNEASRLTDEAKARPQRVLASASTIDAAHDAAADWVLCGRKTLRGRDRPTVFYSPADTTFVKST